MSEDFHDPQPKMSSAAAVCHRLRRIYLPLLLVLLGAWVIRISMFASETSWYRTAAIGSIPGPLVVAIVGGFYLLVLGLTAYPGLRRVEGEFYGSRSDQWEE